MTRDARFWRNVTIVGLIHVIVLVGLLWWSRAPQRTPKDIVWMEGGAGAESAASSQPATPPPENAPVETPEPIEETPPPQATPVARSEIEIPIPTPAEMPRPTETPKPTPTATPKPTPTPTPRPTPKPTPKPKPKPSPTPTPKKKATPKPKSTPDEEAEEAAKETEKKKAAAKTASEKEKSGEEGSPSEKSAEKAGPPGSGEKGKSKGSGGSGGKGSGAGGASEFGWYGNMLHDRFYSEWVQPTSVVHSAKLSVLLRIRISKDGRISDYSISKSSGNPVVDDSVTAAAARVKQVDPLPSGLGDDYYDVNINFELN
jgi:TonB family protein